jgi:hypothetical protein
MLSKFQILILSITIFCILCIITLFILVISIINKKNNNLQNSSSSPYPSPSIQNIKSIKMNEILQKYNDLSNDHENIPNGGLLISLLSTKYLTGNDKYNDYTIDKKCDNNFYVPNLNNISEILIDTAIENNTNCTSFDTTFIRYDCPGILFGPLLDSEKLIINMNIGLILDINKLKKYIACGFPSDAGSVARYNTKNNNSERITDKDLEDYHKLITSPKGKELANAGCGLSWNIYTYPDFYPSGIYNGVFGKTFLPSYIYNPGNHLNWFPGAYSDNKFSPTIDNITYYNDPFNIGVMVDNNYNLNNKPHIKNISPSDYPNGWFNYIKENDKYKYISFDNGEKHKMTNYLSEYYGPFAQPVKKTSFSNLITMIRNKYKDIIRVFGDIPKYFYNVYYQEMYSINAYDIKNISWLNFYFENEIDLYIPNKDATSRLSGLSDGGICAVTDEFQKIWDDCILGIFTNHRCAENIKGSSYQINPISKNYKVIDKNDLQKDFSNELRDNLTEKKMLGRIECNTTNANCCCSENNYENLDNLVTLLVKKYNDNLKPNQRPINGYIMNDDMHLDQDLPSDFDKDKITKPLKIEQITNY